MKKTITLILAALFSASLFGAEVAETYYGYNPNSQGILTLIGTDEEITYSITPLPDGIAVEGKIARMEKHIIPLLTTRHFKIETSKPLVAVLGSVWASNIWGSFFYPTAGDGKKSYGQTFYISPAVVTFNTETIVFTRDEKTVVTVKNSEGEVVSQSDELGANSIWKPQNLVGGIVYKIEATGTISVQSNAANGLTNVPPIPGGRTTEDCNNDLGRRFFFSTFQQGAETGTFAVYNPTDIEARFKVFDLRTGKVLLNNSGEETTTLPAGESYYQGNVGKAYYRLETEGESQVTVWGGSTQTGHQLEDMGDDMTLNFGYRAQDILVNGGNQGAYLFVGDDDTSVVINGGEPEIMNRDDFLNLAPFTTWHIVASKPVTVQTIGGIGGPGLDDWAVALRPALHYDTDGDGKADWDEGSSCRSVAPDYDDDGIPEYLDIDADNDGTEDKNDKCIYDPNKTEPGQCGCGKKEDDADEDGTADCNDQCPDDPEKAEPGKCGCGESDRDSDGDGVSDCVDKCPEDSGKIKPGECGCGNSETSCKETPDEEKGDDDISVSDENNSISDGDSSGSTEKVSDGEIIDETSDIDINYQNDIDEKSDDDMKSDKKTDGKKKSTDSDDSKDSGCSLIVI